MDLSIAQGQVHYFLYQAMLTFKTYSNCVLSTVNLISKQFDFLGNIFSATNRKNMPPRFPSGFPCYGTPAYRVRPMYKIRLCALGLYKSEVTDYE